MISIRPACMPSSHGTNLDFFLIFLQWYICDQCQALHDSSSHRALAVHTIYCSSRVLPAYTSFDNLDLIQGHRSVEELAAFCGETGERWLMVVWRHWGEKWLVIVRRKVTDHGWCLLGDRRKVVVHWGRQEKENRCLHESMEHNKDAINQFCLPEDSIWT